MAKDTLFDIDKDFGTSQEKQGPITCLGLTFANDSERRAYFREELRKRLPELKQIEGFPIGEDEDIINLSDPPYYTACPNPWLNDFISEWESEKNQLETEGKRSKDFEVKEPYASDVSEGKGNPIYLAHGYHTKVPHTAIMRYLLHYTEPGDIVFDGFCGTGMTGVASFLCGDNAEVNALKEANAMIGKRNCICSDLSPIASLISANYNIFFDPKSFEKKASKLLEQVENELGWMFETEVNGKRAKVTSTIWSDIVICPNCGEEINLWEASVNPNEKVISDTFICKKCGFSCSKKNTSKHWTTLYDPILKQSVSQNAKVPVYEYYTISGKRGEQTPKASQINYDKALSILETPIPTIKLWDGYNTHQPINSNGILHTHQFYTTRTCIYLARLWELIGDDSVLKSWFTSAATSTTKMNRFRFSGTGIQSGTLYVPALNWEFTPYYTLKRKIGAFTQILSRTYNNAVSINSATNIPHILDNSIDYIFVDPPFGANIMYSDLNSLLEGWLRVRTNNKEEAIVNDYQNKSLFEYQQLMNSSFEEFYRILKPGKWLTIEFSNTQASVWNSIQNALQGVGFVVANVAALDKKQGSFKAVTTTTAVKQDLVITCYKPSESTTKAFSSSENTDKNVWDFIDEYLHHLPVHIKRDDSTTVVVERSPKILYDRLISYYVQHGYSVPMDAADFQAGLRERYLERDGMFFTSEQVAEYESKKKALPGGVISMGIMVNSEADGIQWLRNELGVESKTRQDLYTGWMQARGAVRKGDKLPEIDDILEENFIKEPDGKWRVPNANDEKDLEILRTKALLKEFNLCVEQASKPKSKIKEVRVEALRAGFKQCYIDKDFKTIVMVGDKIPENLLTEDEVLLQYYDIASSRV